jgi:hypothetical protein
MFIDWKHAGKTTSKHHMLLCCVIALKDDCPDWLQHTASMSLTKVARPCLLLESECSFKHFVKSKPPTDGCCLPYPCSHEWLACPLGLDQNVSHNSNHHFELLRIEVPLGQTKLLNNQRSAGQHQCTDQCRQLWIQPAAGYT